MFKLNNKLFRFLIILFICFSILFLVIPWGLHVLYPFPYQKIIKKNADKVGLAPNLIAAVIRIESRFRPKVESAKGAKGLMQLLPDTAEWVNEQKKISSTEVNLYNPEENIALGTWYLAYLIRDFDGNLIAALASYNGGRKNVMNWLANDVWSGKLEDIENIPFKETRNFVSRVISSYKIYNILYK